MTIEAGIKAGVEELIDSTGYPVDAAISQVTVMVRAYTRGRGFFENREPNEDLQAIITTAAARLAANGRQMVGRDKVGDVEREYRSSFTGWTLPELAVLHRYRTTAM